MLQWLRVFPHGRLGEAPVFPNSQISTEDHKAYKEAGEYDPLKATA